MPLTNSTTSGAPDDDYTPSGAPANDPYDAGVPEEPVELQLERAQMLAYLGHTGAEQSAEEQPVAGNPNGAAPPVDRVALTARARQLVELGWHVEPVGKGKAIDMPCGYTKTMTVETIDAVTAQKVAEGRVDGIAVVLGKRSRRPGTGCEPSTYLYAFEFEGRAMDGFHGEFREIVKKLDAEDIFGRLANGWVEDTPRVRVGGVVLAP